ncbi:MAG: ERCC4 domain-containing protein [bacterium]
MNSRPESRPLCVIADLRERVSGIPQALSKLGLEVRLRNLTAGDYILAPHIAIERKTTSDFIQSIFDRRFFHQTHLLRAAFQHPLWLLEENECPAREIHPHAYRGALLYLTVLNHIPILHSKNADDTATLIYAILQMVYQDPDRNFTLHPKKRTVSLDLTQRYVLETLPGIGPHLADELLQRFGSLQAICSAQTEELMQIPGVGQARADRIHEILHRTYKK